jgi:SAM-dependent methyltransferase
LPHNGGVAHAISRQRSEFAAPGQSRRIGRTYALVNGPRAWQIKRCVDTLGSLPGPIGANAASSPASAGARAKEQVLESAAGPNDPRGESGGLEEDSLEVDSLERLVPERMDPADRGAQETLELHLERYRFAAEHARPGRLLDLACGVGYGTRLVADARPAVVSALGVDLSHDAVAYAQREYADTRVEYRQADGMAFADAEGFDTIISLETVEHVPDPDALFSRLVGLLRPGGVLVSSVPTTPSVDLNPHHASDFTEREFREMGGSHGLRVVGELPQVQSHNPLELMGGQRFDRTNLRSNLVGYYLRHPDAAWKRLVATLRFGFASHYITLAWQRD